MALPATGVINIMSTATAGNLNGGGFNAARGGTDYSLQNGAQINGTDGTSNASTNFNSSAQTFTSAMAGNYLHLTAGTNGTAGWYEIVAYVDANNVTLDRNCSTGSMTDGTFYVGGAMSLGSTLDDDLFEIGVAGNVFNVKGGATYTLGETVSIAATGGASLPIIVRGYTTSPGDACNGTSRPVFSLGAAACTFAANWNVYNLIFSGTGSACFVVGASGVAQNCKSTNTSTTAARPAISLGTNSAVINCEGVSYRGPAFSTATGNASIRGCYAHDSNIGILGAPTTNTVSYIGNIVANCVTAAIQVTSAAVGGNSIEGNTLFGSTTKTGIGISLASGTTNMRVRNNIITGFVTGVSHADTQSVGYDNYNNFYNNTADVSNAGQWQKGANDSAVNPSFTSVGQVTGATASTTSGNHLVQAGATFTTSGVTAGRDYVYVISGTGVTAGIYGIASVDSETQITTDITLSANSTEDKVFQITTGQNFAVGTAMKALGFPGAFQGGYTTGYVEQGAVQRQEPAASGSGGSFTFIG